MGPGMPESQYAVNGNCSGLTPTSDCPFNFWRLSGDPEPGWGTIMRELNSLRAFQLTEYGNDTRQHPPYNADPPRSRPGGWGYPGTMVVGDGSMTKDENRVHFGGWCIVSSNAADRADLPSGCILLEMAAISLLTGELTADPSLQPLDAGAPRARLGHHHEQRGHPDRKRMCSDRVRPLVRSQSRR